MSSNVHYRRGGGVSAAFQGVACVVLLVVLVHLAPLVFLLAAFAIAYPEAGSVIAWLYVAVYLVVIVLLARRLIRILFFRHTLRVTSDGLCADDSWRALPTQRD